MVPIAAKSNSRKCLEAFLHLMTHLKHAEMKPKTFMSAGLFMFGKKGFFLKPLQVPRLSTKR